MTDEDFAIVSRAVMNSTGKQFGILNRRSDPPSEGSIVGRTVLGAAVITGTETIDGKPSFILDGGQYIHADNVFEESIVCITPFFARLQKASGGAP